MSCYKSKSAARGALRTVLEHARRNTDCSLGDLTVLSTQVDPYRLDTPAGHRDGHWLAGHMNKLLGTTRRIHWRGLHYVLVSAKRPVVKPDGEIYRNTDEDWLWLSGVAGKAARWLGYIPFERITDNRNAAPIIHRHARVEPEAFVSIGLDVTVPDADDIEPVPIAEGFEPRQPSTSQSSGRRLALKMFSTRSQNVIKPISICPPARSATPWSIRSPGTPTPTAGR
jgi:hypothetical protein